MAAAFPHSFHHTVDDAPTLNPSPTATSDGDTCLFDLLAGTTDADGDSFSVTSTTQPTHGTVQRVGDQWQYTPSDPRYFGQDSFQYTVTDSSGLASTGTVSFTVTGGHVVCLEAGFIMNLSPFHDQQKY
jgi:hypothetical protein